MLEGKAPGQDGRVAGNRGNRPELLHRRVVDAEEETVLDGMVVCDLPSGAPPRLGPAAAAVEGDGGRHVEAAPARPPQPQRQVRVLAVKKEILVEPPGRDPDGVERGSPVERRRRSTGEPRSTPSGSRPGGSTRISFFTARTRTWRCGCGGRAGAASTCRPPSPSTAAAAGPRRGGAPLGRSQTTIPSRTVSS